MSCLWVVEVIALALIVHLPDTALDHHLVDDILVDDDEVDDDEDDDKK